MKCELNNVCSDLSLNADRCGPVDVFVTPVFSGLPTATIAWSFNGLTNDLSEFEVTVEVKGEGVVSKESVRSDDRRVMVGNLQPSKNHIITVTAMYADKIERHTSLEYKHSGTCFVIHTYAECCISIQISVLQLTSK